MVDHRAVESWTWFAFATSVFILRFVSRAVHMSRLHLDLEDYVMLVAFCFYLNLIIWVNVQEGHPRTNILAGARAEDMSQDELEARVFGSKVTFVLEESMIMVQFLTKVSMCLFFLRLTAGVKRQMQVKFLLIYVIFGWLTTEVFFFGIWCRPFVNYFRVFDNNDRQCTTAQHHLIMSFAFNISSDVLMLIITLPISLTTNLPLRQKVMITGLFSLGIFVIVSAALSRYYCFAHPESILWIYWYVREASTAVLVVNIPQVYSLIRWVLKPLHLSASSGKSNTLGHSIYGRGVELKDSSKISGSGSNPTYGKNRTESMENFATETPKPLQIWQHNEYSVNCTPADVEDEDRESAIWQGKQDRKVIVTSNI